MSGEREGRRGVVLLFPPSRDDRVTPPTTGGGICPSTSDYGSTGASMAPFVHDKGFAARRRRRQQQQQQLYGEESSLLRRALAGVGVLSLFVFAVTTANNRRLETGQLRAPSAKTTLVRVSNTCIPVSVHPKSV